MRYLAALLLLSVAGFAQSGTYQPTLRLPDAPSHVADKEFWAVQAMSWTAAAFDIHSTRHMITQCGWSEANPIYGRSPSTARLVLTNIALKVGSGLLSYRLKKQNKWYWSLFAISDTAMHSSLAAHNYSCSALRTLHPGEK